MPSPGWPLPIYLDSWNKHKHSVQFSSSVMSDSLQPYGPQHARLPYPSPTPKVHLNSSPLSQWCHATISSSVLSFSSCLQKSTQTHVHWVSDAIQPSHHLSSPLLLPSIFPASGSSQMSQLFTSGGQSIGVSASTSVLSMNTSDWFPLGWTGWISLQSKGLSRVLIPQFKSINSLALSFLYSP